jgi:polysaccharide export outer membrane protein
MNARNPHDMQPRQLRDLPCNQLFRCWREIRFTGARCALLLRRAVSVATQAGFAAALTCLVATTLVAGVACSPAIDNSRVQLPPPIESTTVGPDDVFVLRIVGEKDLPEEYQVASDGTVDLPYIHRVSVSGLEPHEIARVVRERLIGEKILRDPSVVVMIKEYRSKKITVLGQVQKPGSFPLTSGLTLLQAVSLSGGFTSIAKTNQVRLTRKVKEGAKTVVLSVDSITDGRSPDVPLQAGDVLYISERVF